MHFSEPEISKFFQTPKHPQLPQTRLCCVNAFSNNYCRLLPKIKKFFYFTFLGIPIKNSWICPWIVQSLLGQQFIVDDQPLTKEPVGSGYKSIFVLSSWRLRFKFSAVLFLANNSVCAHYTGLPLVGEAKILAKVFIWKNIGSPPGWPYLESEWPSTLCHSAPGWTS